MNGCTSCNGKCPCEMACELAEPAPAPRRIHPALFVGAVFALVFAILAAAPYFS